MSDSEDSKFDRYFVVVPRYGTSEVQYVKINIFFNPREKWSNFLDTVRGIVGPNAPQEPIMEIPGKTLSDAEPGVPNFEKGHLGHIVYKYDHLEGRAGDFGCTVVEQITSRQYYDHFKNLKRVNTRKTPKPFQVDGLNFFCFDLISLIPDGEGRDEVVALLKAKVAEAGMDIKEIDIKEYYKQW